MSDGPQPLWRKSTSPRSFIHIFPLREDTLAELSLYVQGVLQNIDTNYLFQSHLLVFDPFGFEHILL